MDENMAGYERVADFHDLKDGDVLVFPGRKPRLHASAKTLARYGLSVGSTSRAENDERVVNRWFLGTKGDTMYAMATHVESHAAETEVARGTNSLAALKRTRELNLAEFAILDKDALPTTERGVMAVVPLVAAVVAAYTSYMREDAVAGLDSWRMAYRDSPAKKWTALMSATDRPFGLGGDELIHAPFVSESKATGPDGDRMLWKLFGGSSLYEWRNGSHDCCCRVRARAKALDYFAKQGMEAWRPLPATWERLAWTLLLRHAAKVLRECGTFDTSIIKFDEEYRRELVQYRKFKKAWTEIAGRIGRKLK